MTTFKTSQNLAAFKLVALLALALALLLASCSILKDAQQARTEKRIDKAKSFLMRKGVLAQICADEYPIDTTAQTLSIDTTVSFDTTIHYVHYDSSTGIIRQHRICPTRTVTITRTVSKTVVDSARLKAQAQEIARLAGENNRQKGIIEDRGTTIKRLQKEKFWLAALVAALALALLRKPIIRGLQKLLNPVSMFYPF